VAIGGLLLVVVGGPLAWLERQGVTLKYAGSIVMARLHLVSVAGPDMVTISGGSYQQGDILGLGSHEQGSDVGQPVRQVTIKPFFIGKYEVTFQEYDRYVELTGGRAPDDAQWGRAEHPVFNVSWDEAVAYAKWLSEATGKRYRLPTESEWEYAARSGGKDDIWAGTSDEEQLKGYAVYSSHPGTAVVGSKKSNALGLFDMSGNVWEWVEDCWHGDYTSAPTDGSAWPEVNGGNCSLRVLRGGSWVDSRHDLRSFHRFGFDALNRTNYVGFRLAMDLAP
jgi:formylglycine-generating enzyme required for sulfatase activity